MTLLEVVALLLFGAAAGSLLTVLLIRHLVRTIPEDDQYMRSVQKAEDERR